MNVTIRGARRDDIQAILALWDVSGVRPPITVVERHLKPGGVSNGWRLVGELTRSLDPRGPGVEAC